MEAIVMAMRWEDFGEAAVIFQGLRSDKGEQMILSHHIAKRATCLLCRQTKRRRP